MKELIPDEMPGYAKGYQDALDDVAGSIKRDDSHWFEEDITAVWVIHLLDVLSKELKTGRKRGNEMKFEREIKFIPLHGSVDIKFYLKGEKGIIQFAISTGWQEDADHGLPSKTYPYDIGYHSPVPIYEDQKPMPECQFYHPCYYDGSSMYARDVFKLLVNHGEERVWRELEKTYYNWLDKDSTANEVK